MPRVLDVKQAVESVLWSDGFSRDGWDAMRRAAEIPPGKHSCTPLQEKFLWLAVCERRVKPLNQPVTYEDVVRRWLTCRGNIKAAIPGFIEIPEVKALPRTCQGWELPEIIEQYTGYCPPDNRLTDWFKKLDWGFNFSRNEPYSAAQQHALICLWVKMRIEERERAKKRAVAVLHPNLGVA